MGNILAKWRWFYLVDSIVITTDTPTDGRMDGATFRCDVNFITKWVCLPPMLWGYTHRMGNKVETNKKYVSCHTFQNVFFHSIVPVIVPYWRFFTHTAILATYNILHNHRVCEDFIWQLNKFYEVNGNYKRTDQRILRKEK